jgi:hypothetical protein
MCYRHLKLSAINRLQYVSENTTHKMFLTVHFVREREQSSADINVRDVHVWRHVLNRYNKFCFSINKIFQISFFHFPPALILLVKCMLPFAAEGQFSSTRVVPKILIDGLAFLSTVCPFTPHERSHVRCGNLFFLMID